MYTTLGPSANKKFITDDDGLQDAFCIFKIPCPAKAGQGILKFLTPPSNVDQDYQIENSAMRAQKIFILTSVFLVCCFGILGSEEIDEKNLLQNSYFGNFKNPLIQKKSGEDILQIWGPYVQYTETLPSFFLLEGSRNLHVVYDEIWIQEKEKEELHKLYWKNNQIQAATVEKYFFADPMSRKSLPRPSYEIINIYNREFILRKLQEVR
jgi:hypothetical protein